MTTKVQGALERLTKLAECNTCRQEVHDIGRWRKAILVAREDIRTILAYIKQVHPKKDASNKVSEQ